MLAYYYFREAHATHASPVDPPMGRVTGENSKNVHGSTAARLRFAKLHLDKQLDFVK